MLPTLKVCQKSEAWKGSDCSQKLLFPSRKGPAATIATTANAFEKGRTVVQRRQGAACKKHNCAAHHQEG